MHRVLLMAVGLLVLVVGVAADPGPVRADEGKEQVEIVLPEPMALEEFLRLAQQRLGLPLVWDPKSRAFQGRMMTPDLRFEGTRQEVFESIRGLLTAFDLVVIPVGIPPNQKLYVADVRQAASMLRLKPTYVELNDDNVALYEHKDGLFLTTTIQVENLENLRDARNALNRVVTGQNIGNVTEVPDARAFVVTDFAPNVVSVYRLLKQMDVPVAARGPDTTDREVVFESITIEHGSAKDITALLRKHFALDAPPPPRRPTAPNQSPATVPAAPRMHVDADARLNQVLVTGMRKDVKRVAEVIAALDRPRPASSLKIEMIELEHIQAGRAAMTLSALIQRAPRAWLNESGAQDLPVVEAHAERNALLIQAGEAAAETLRRVIREMDTRVLEERVDEESGDEGKNDE